MVQLSLPKNSKVTSGKAWPALKSKDGATSSRVKTFKIYRYDPSDGKNPYWDTYQIDLDDCGPLTQRSPSAALAVKAFAALAR